MVGTCLYFRNRLALKKIKIYHVTEWALCEVNKKRQVGYAIVSYRSQSQTSSQSDDF